MKVNKNNQGSRPCLLSSSQGFHFRWNEPSCCGHIAGYYNDHELLPVPYLLARPPAGPLPRLPRLLAIRCHQRLPWIQHTLHWYLTR